MTQIYPNFSTGSQLTARKVQITHRLETTVLDRHWMYSIFYVSAISKIEIVIQLVQSNWIGVKSSQVHGLRPIKSTELFAVLDSCQIVSHCRTLQSSLLVPIFVDL